MDFSRKKGNIVPFPGTVDKLITDGLHALKQADKSKAESFFQEALIHEPEHEEAAYGLLLAYAETNQLTKARLLAEDMMKKDSGDYYEILQVYVSVLAQLEQYEEVIVTLEAVMDEESIPPKLRTELEYLLTVSKNMQRTIIETEEESRLPITYEASEPDWVPLLRSGSPEEKMAVLQELRQHRSLKSLPYIQTLLTSEHTSPLLKSFLVLLLKDWEVERTIEVHKLKRQGEFSPETLPDINNSTSYLEATAALDQVIGDKDPTLMQHIIHLLQQMLLYYYPFPPSVQIPALSAMLHYEAAVQSGYEMEVEATCQSYDVSVHDFQAVHRDYERIQKQLTTI